MIKKAISKVRKHSISKYLVVGGLAFIAEYGSFYILYQSIHAHLIIANTISFAAGLAVSFTGNRHWTFNEPGSEYEKKISHQFALFSGLAIFNLISSNIIISLLKTSGLDPRVGKIITMGMIALWNFAIFNKKIFPKATR